MTAVYDEIGLTYDFTRKADPKITQTITQLLSPFQEGEYLDIACGSGNYTHALHSQGYKFTGIDLSEEMLSKAKRKSTVIKWILGNAKKLPFPNNAFDGATCILASHHIQDIDVAFLEAYRTMKRGRFVIFTAFPDQMRGYWLNHYFPEAMDAAAHLMHTRDQMNDTLYSSGFQNIQFQPFFVTNELEDWFLHAGKYRPHLYLNPIVRAGISTFALAKNQQEIVDGCNQLERDIASGAIQEVIKDFENDQGDYTFIVCSKI